jgi:hypothetical protein
MSVEEIKRVRGGMPSEKSWTWPKEINRAIELADTALVLYSEMEGIELLVKDTMKDCDNLRTENERLRRYERAWREISSVLTYDFPKTLKKIADNCGIKESHEISHEWE